MEALLVLKNQCPSRRAADEEHQSKMQEIMEQQRLERARIAVKILSQKITVILLTAVFLWTIHVAKTPEAWNWSIISQRFIFLGGLVCVPTIAARFPGLLSKPCSMMAHSALLVAIVWYHGVGLGDQREIASCSVFRVILGIMVGDFRFCAISNLVFSVVLCSGPLFRDVRQFDSFMISEAWICVALMISLRYFVLVAEHLLELQESLGAQLTAQSDVGVEAGPRKPKHESVLLKSSAPSKDNAAPVSQPAALILFDAQDPDLHIIEVSDEWTKLFGESIGSLSLFDWLGQSLIVDFQMWIAKLVDDSVINGWSAANAKHKFRRVVSKLPDGSKVSVVIFLTLLDPGAHETAKQHLATLSAECVGEKRRRPSKSGSLCNRSRSSCSYKRVPAMPSVPEGEDKSSSPITAAEQKRP